MYKLVSPIQTPEGPKVVNSVKRIADGAHIPFDEANSDYQIYLKWLDGYEQQFNPETHKLEWVLTTPGGNTPQPADE